MNREARKIWINPAIWELLKDKSEKEGKSISELVEAIIMDKYNWQESKEEEEDARLSANFFRALIRRALEYSPWKDKPEDATVLYCKECSYLWLQSRHSIAPMTCSKCQSKGEIIGTANNLI